MNRDPTLHKVRNYTIVSAVAFITLLHVIVLAIFGTNWMQLVFSWLVASLGSIIIIYLVLGRLDKLQTELQFQLEKSIGNSERQAAIASLSGGFTTTLTEDEICDELARRLNQVRGYEFVAVYLLDEARENRILKANIGGLGSPNAHVIPRGKGLSEKPIIDGVLQYTPDVSQHARYIPGLGHGSEVDVPIQYDRDILGVLVIENHEVDAFGPEDFTILKTAASQAALAIQNTRLLATEVKRRQTAEILQNAVMTVSSELDLDQVLERILTQLAEVVPYDSSCVFLWQGNYLEAKFARGLPHPENVIGKFFPADDELFNIILETRKPVILEDIREDSRFQGWGGTSEMCSWMGIPLIISNQTIGYLTLDSREVNSYDQEMAELAVIFGYQAAVAIQNAQLFYSTKNISEKLIILHKASQDITRSSLDPERTYVTIHKAAKSLMPCEAFCITILNENNNEIDAVYLIDRDGRAPKMSIPVNQGLSGHIIATGETLLVQDFQDPENAKNIDVIHFGNQDHIRAFIAVPLRRGSKVVGMLSAQSYQPHEYTIQDQQLLEMLAAHAAIALDNAHLFAQVQRLAITDSLTEVYNRRYFFDAAHREYSRAKRYQRPLSIIMLDLDNYKMINDTCGHMVGDLALIKISKIIQENIRESDILCRYGGDEFSILLPETELAQALESADRLRQLIGNQPFTIEGHEFPITMSIGVATSHDDIPDVSQLLMNADAALYEAKHGGRNRVCFRQTPQ
jgi:diguanylate cyclase (GGDEF)-like protein